MVFNSLDFIFFFPLVLLIYYVIPGRVRYLWLLFASYFFYMSWNAKYALLLLVSTVTTYISGILIDKIKGSGNQRSLKTVVAGSFLINLGILIYFKYFGFGLSLLKRLLLEMNIHLNIPYYDVILPIGISFYTFQALSYTIDLYRGDIKAEKNFFRYALFVSFFPQLVAGPIERSKYLLKELKNPRRVDYNEAIEGFLLMLWGYFLKIVIADRVALFVDIVYNDYKTYSGWYLITATILFAIQIYCDFAGYSTIALGTAKILGIRLSRNFDAPYLSVSVADFWRRWHISLTNWFRDYLYFPMGGNRKGKFRKYLNQIIVFLVSGLWHGASLSFIVWGGLNGIYQITEEISAPLRDKLVRLFRLDRKTISHKLMRGVITFFLIDFSWVFFRADQLKNALKIIGSMFTASNIWIFFDGSIFNCGIDSANFVIVIVAVTVLTFVDICRREGIEVPKVILRQHFLFQCIFITASIALILIFGIWGQEYDASSFIYFQF